MTRATGHELAKVVRRSLKDYRFVHESHAPLVARAQDVVAAYTAGIERLTWLIGMLDGAGDNPERVALALDLAEVRRSQAPNDTWYVEVIDEIQILFGGPDT